MPTVTDAAAASATNGTLSSEGLPEGWTMQVAPNGRVFFIDHNSKETTWVSFALLPNAAVVYNVYIAATIVLDWPANQSTKHGAESKQRTEQAEI